MWAPVNNSGFPACFARWGALDSQPACPPDMFLHLMGSLIKKRRKRMRKKKHKKMLRKTRYQRK